MTLSKRLPYGRQNISKDDIKAVNEVLVSDWLTQGPKVEEFERALAKFCGSKYAVAISSGTAGLHLALLATGLKSGTEVITTPITFAATANAVLYSDARPVFVDIASDGNIDGGLIEANVTKKTKVILPVHFAGQPCDMPTIHRLARKHGLRVIEDAAHALGAEYKLSGKWHRVGSCKNSDMTVFSFHPVKHITTGEGGAITTNSKELYEKLIALRQHGIYRPAQADPWFYEVRELGFNYRITDFQCALGISQLKKINSFIKDRRRLAAWYRKEITNIKEISFLHEHQNVRHAYHLSIVCIDFKSCDITRKSLMLALRKDNIFTQVHYIPVYKHPLYRKLGFASKLCDQAESYYIQALSLPLFPGMTKQDVIHVVDRLKFHLRIKI